MNGCMNRWMEWYNHEWSYKTTMTSGSIKVFGAICPLSKSSIDCLVLRVPMSSLYNCFPSCILNGTFIYMRCAWSYLQMRMGKKLIWAIHIILFNETNSGLIQAITVFKDFDLRCGVQLQGHLGNTFLVYVQVFEH